MKLTEEQIKTAAEVNIVDYCNANGIPLVLKSRDTYVHREYDSLYITGKKWIRHSGKTQLLGRFTQGNAIAFVREYTGCGFPEAVMRLLEFIHSPLAEQEPSSLVKRLRDAKTKLLVNNLPKLEAQQKEESGQKNEETQDKPTEKEQAPEKIVEFKLPPKNVNAHLTIAYLTNRRCIDSEIVSEMIQMGKIYEESERHNCVFVGADKNGNLKYAGMKGTGKTPFVQEVKGSQKKYSWSYTPNKPSVLLRVYESPIDAMSDMTLEKMVGGNWKNKHRLSLAGTSFDAIEYYLSIHSEITHVTFCLDNDDAGRKATKEHTIRLQPQRYQCTNSPPNKDYKDYNEALCAKIRKNMQE